MFSLLQKIKVPPGERGFKQLGRLNAIWQLAQLAIFFGIGAMTTLEDTGNVALTRLLMANYGIAYAFEVSHLHYVILIDP